MFDWNWIFVAGEVCVACVFYWSSRNDRKFSSLIEALPTFDIDDLEKLSPSVKSIELGTVHGLVQALDSKPNSILKSQFVNEVRGVIQRVTVQEKNLHRRWFWPDSSQLITEMTRFVPFRLISPVGKSIRIDQPLDFDLIKNHLQVVYENFESNDASSIQKLIEFIAGTYSTGLQRKEEILLIDTPLTGIGRLDRSLDGIWRLIPHQRWGGILTRSTRDEVINELRERANTALFISIALGITALTTTAYFAYRHYFKFHQRRPNRLPTSPPTDNSSRNQNRLSCVICLENEVLYSLQPCSHLGLCHSCAVELQARDERCPLCRGPIEQFQRVFFP